MGNHVHPRRAPSAVLDLGSNTVLLLVLESGGGVAVDEARITRLGQGVFENGRLHPEARRRTAQAVEELTTTARRAGADRILAVGTEALRRAEDGAAFLDELCARGWVDEARILSGVDEARYAVEASRRAAGDAARLCVIDVGGGSTELAWARGDAIEGASFPVGAVRLTEARVTRHPVPPAELAALRAECAEVFAPVRERATREPDSAVVAVAGTATTLAALDLRLDPWDPDAVEGWRAPRERVTAWIERLAALDVASRRALPGLEPGRADVIVAGLVALEQALAALDAGTFAVSGRGVRHGVALERLESVEVPENAC